MTIKDFWEPYRTSTKVYMPAITKARWVKRFKIGAYSATVGTDCESVGGIYYVHIMYVFKEGHSRAYLAVSSEYTDLTGQDGSRCLGMFFGGVHFNMGFSHDWADLEKFTHKALEVVMEPLGASAGPPELLFERP